MAMSGLFVLCSSVHVSTLSLLCYISVLKYVAEGFSFAPSLYKIIDCGINNHDLLHSAFQQIQYIYLQYTERLYRIPFFFF